MKEKYINSYRQITTQYKCMITLTVNDNILLYCQTPCSPELHIPSVLYNIKFFFSVLMFAQADFEFYLTGQN